MHSHDRISSFLFRATRPPLSLSAPLLLLIKPRLGDFLFCACLKPTLHSRKFLVTVSRPGASRNRVTPPSAKFVVAFITPARTFPGVKFYFPPGNRPSAAARVRAPIDGPSPRWRRGSTLGDDSSPPPSPRAVELGVMGLIHPIHNCG